MKCFVTAVLLLLLSAPAWSADALPAQGPPLPPKLTVYYAGFTSAYYSEVTPDNIRSGGSGPARATTSRAGATA